jgi:hypothetical protein
MSCHAFVNAAWDRTQTLDLGHAWRKFQNSMESTIEPPVELQRLIFPELDDMEAAVLEVRPYAYVWLASCPAGAHL